jgi:hypothetical protein
MTSGKENSAQNHVERLLINHCSSVLFGGKPSALFMVRTEKCYSCLMESINQFDNNTSSLVLRNTQNGLLTLFYRPGILHRAIMEADTRELLRFFGYTQSMPDNVLQSYLDVLKRRFAECQEFPHEIGFFLGYPINDVLGFIEQKGRNYKYCGLWKVYSNVKKARELFRHYENCRVKSKKFLREGWLQ